MLALRSDKRLASNPGSSIYISEGHWDATSTLRASLSTAIKRDVTVPTLRGLVSSFAPGFYIGFIDLLFNFPPQANYSYRKKKNAVRYQISCCELANNSGFTTLFWHGTRQSDWHLLNSGEPSWSLNCAYTCSQQVNIQYVIFNEGIKWQDEFYLGWSHYSSLTD